MSESELIYNDLMQKSYTSGDIVDCNFSNYIAANDPHTTSAIYRGDDLIIVAIQSAMLTYLGASDLLGNAASAIFKDTNQSFLYFLKAAYKSASVVDLKGFQFESIDDLSIVKCDHVFQPIFNNEKAVCAILHTATICDNNLEQFQFESQNRESLSYFYQSPVALAILDKEDLAFRYVNPFYASLVGRTEKEILNQPFRDILPELDGQGFDVMLEEVMASKVPFIDSEVSATLNRNGVKETFYVSLTCSPRFDDRNAVCGVSIVATDVTEQVMQRKKVEEVSQSLLGAIALANLGTWEIDLTSGISQYSDRLRHWLGYTNQEVITMERFFEPIPTKFHEIIKNEIIAATQGSNAGIYEVEYEIVNRIDKSKRILHAQGQTYFNENNEAIKICGTVSDVTKDRKLRLELRRRVVAQTEELAAANQQLELANKKMAKTMTALEISNIELLRSNNELSQYAYVASHDLQEPLRKIQIYSSILNQEENLSEKALLNLDRISQSSKRMSLLIKDLLEFSSAVKSDKMFRPVNLNDTLANILTDFELLIAEKNASIVAGELPTVHAIGLQMNQLFYNLVSNALKFCATNKLIKITITAEKLKFAAVERFISNPIPQSAYYAIAIQDNGIGFDVQYADLIFEVFKRLHPKEIYPGSGIGLALCRRIITNHRGALLVESKPEIGTTFTIILPETNS